MIAMSRLNTTITDHTMITNAIAASLLVSGVIVGAVALSQNGTLTKAYDTVSPSTTATQVKASDTTASQQDTTLLTSTIVLGKSTPISLQTTTAATQLQPAQNTQGASASVNNVQPSANSEQQTGATPQNATAKL